MPADSNVTGAPAPALTPQSGEENVPEGVPHQPEPEPEPEPEPTSGAAEQRKQQADSEAQLRQAALGGVVAGSLVTLTLQWLGEHAQQLLSPPPPPPPPPPSPSFPVLPRPPPSIRSLLDYSTIEELSRAVAGPYNAIVVGGGLCALLLVCCCWRSQKRGRSSARSKSSPRSGFRRKRRSSPGISSTLSEREPQVQLDGRRIEDFDDPISQHAARVLFADKSDLRLSPATRNGHRTGRRQDDEREELQLGRYRVGDAVTYRATDGREHFAIISELHLDDLGPDETPEVTIRFADDGNERRTMTSRLAPRQHSAAKSGFYGTTEDSAYTLALRDVSTAYTLALRDVEAEEQQRLAEQRMWETERELTRARMASPSMTMTSSPHTS